MIATEPAVQTESEAKRLSVTSQLVRFVLIGGLCALIDSGTYATLLSLGTPNYVSKAISFILGTTASYFANKKFTFTASTGNAKAQAGGFALVYIVTFFVNVGTNQLLYALLPAFDMAHGTQIRYAVCWIVAQGLGTAINFVMLKWVVFKD